MSKISVGSLSQEEVDEAIKTGKKPVNLVISNIVLEEKTFDGLTKLAKKKGVESLESFLHGILYYHCKENKLDPDSVALSYTGYRDKLRIINTLITKEQYRSLQVACEKYKVTDVENLIQGFLTKIYEDHKND